MSIEAMNYAYQQAKLWAEYVGLHESRQAEWVAWDEKRKGLRK